MRVQETVLPIADTARLGFATRLVRMGVQAWRLWANRRAMRQLREMSDWELRDIGLEPEDIARAYQVPIYDDPTRRLQQIARERARREMLHRRRS
ncbi:DUF1127 domain-containing protein [Chelativorans intermedius]|uniref:DUF1127 domain-containing protein n=1 Tax=Chelativorans intermedius TaxID=515947 RepID=A0ABV6D5E0_9HYPH|nr:DUF1127 domain-containing protein [Chelativorans intermedius]MCT8998778.1 DUF1127 domain-containing protein [Chelativorans intermedius]